MLPPCGLPASGQLVPILGLGSQSFCSQDFFALEYLKKLLSLSVTFINIYKFNILKYLLIHLK